MARPDRIRAWFVRAWVTFALLVALLALGSRSFVVVCDKTITQVPEPKGWHAWPLATPGDLPRLDDVQRLTCRAMRSYGPLLNVYARGTPPRVLSHEDPPRFENPDAIWETWLRHDSTSGLLVAAGAPRDEDAPRERFLYALRIDRVPWHLEWGDWALPGIVLMGLAFASILGAMGLARRRLRRSRAIADPLVYKRGVRDTTGSIAFDDGSLPLVIRDAPGAPLEGPVLVRVVASSPGTYRSAPETKGAHVLRGERHILSAAAQEASVRALRRGVLAAGCIAGIFALRELTRLL